MPSPIKGYAPLDPLNVETVNENKMVEELVMRLTEEIFENSETDSRWVAIARTHFQEGFMALNRAVMQPQRIETMDVAQLTSLSNRLASKV